MASWDHDYVINGMVRDLNGKEVYSHFEGKTPSRHLTVVFNLFVFLQIFNMLGARKINDELNIFEGVCSNSMFVVVWFVIVGGQILIVQFGSIAMKVHVNGLTSSQWLITVAVASASLVINFFMKFLPDTLCPTLGDEDPADVEMAKKDYINLRKTRELSNSIRQGSHIKNKEGSMK